MPDGMGPFRYSCGSESRIYRFSARSQRRPPSEPQATRATLRRRMAAGCCSSAFRPKSSSPGRRADYRPGMLRSALCRTARLSDVRKPRPDLPGKVIPGRVKSYTSASRTRFRTCDFRECRKQPPDSFVRDSRTRRTAAHDCPASAYFRQTSPTAAIRARMSSGYTSPMFPMRNVSASEIFPG